MSNKKVVVITAQSESCDTYGPWLFDSRPSDEELEVFLKKNAPGEFEDENDGPGIFGSYLHINIVEREIL